MSKRKLTRRQQWRVEKIQSEKAKRLQKNEQELQSVDTDSEHHQGLVIARHGKQLEIIDLEESPEQKTEERKVYLCHIRANIPDMVVGDKVIWSRTLDNQNDMGVIEALSERDSLLLRKDKNGQEKIIAANISQVFIVLASEPQTPELVIDRYVSACTLLDLPIKILVNKSDLPDGETLLKDLKENYQQVAEEIFSCSIKNTAQLECLEEKLAGKNSIFIGQSGVGKSSLVKTLLGRHEIKTRALSEKSGLGQHTTSTSRLYLLDNGGYIIDSPGIRDFDLDEISLEELKLSYREISTIETPCKFRDCSHHLEPDCEVRKAVEDGRIPELRYKNYLSLAEQLGLLK